MKYVKLTARPDSWFVEGTEVWDYDEDRRLTEEECHEYCRKKEYPEEFCFPTEGSYGNEEENLEIHHV